MLQWLRFKHWMACLPHYTCTSTSTCISLSGYIYNNYYSDCMNFLHCTYMYMTLYLYVLLHVNVLYLHLLVHVTCCDCGISCEHSYELMITGTPPLPLVPTRSIRARWVSLIHELATSDTTMTTEEIPIAPLTIVHYNYVMQATLNCMYNVYIYIYCVYRHAYNVMVSPSRSPSIPFCFITTIYIYIHILYTCI